MSDDDKTPARDHPVARPIRSQGTTGSHRQELMVGLFKDGRGVFNGTALKEASDLIEALALSEDVQPVHIRVAPGSDGRRGWDPREVCWRRAQLTGDELPLPAKDVKGLSIPRGTGGGHGLISGGIPAA